MLGLPGTGWTAGGPGADEITTSAPADLDWREAGSVDHVFTHFRLTLRVLTAEGDAPGSEWLAEAALGDLPSVFLKAARRALGMSAVE
jgi:A/G-specific adenine glycosylase